MAGGNQVSRSRSTQERQPKVANQLSHLPVQNPEGCFASLSDPVALAKGQGMNLYGMLHALIHVIVWI